MGSEMCIRDSRGDMVRVRHHTAEKVVNANAGCLAHSQSLGGAAGRTSWK